MYSYLTGLELTNFRGFKEKTTFALRPITILTGTNNSGKSSVSKALLLMKENMAKDNIAALNLGYIKGLSIANFFNVEAKSDTFEISLATANVANSSEFMNPAFSNPATGEYLLFENRDNRFYLPPIHTDDATYSISYRPDKDALYPSIFELGWQQFSVQLAENKSKFFFTSYPKDDAINSEWRGLEVVIDEGLVDKLLIELEVELSAEQRQKLFGLIKKLLTQVKRLYYRPPFSDFFPSKAQNLIDFPELYRQAFINHTDGIQKSVYNAEVKEMEELFIPNSCFHITLSQLLKAHFEVEPSTIGGLAYSLQQFLPRLVEHQTLLRSLPSFQGLKAALDKLYFINTVKVQQLPFYLQDYNSDTFAGLITRLANNISLLYDVLPFINYWVKAFEVGDTIRLQTTANGSELLLIRGNHTFNVNNIGFGSLQLISLILTIAVNPQKIVLLEEPEINLHPKVQSKLADFIIDSSYKFDIQFIVETHSEYLIRKLQYWVAKKELRPEDVIIHYLFDPLNKPEQEEQVRVIEINEDGSMENNFGTGFFDEATNIQFELLKLNQQQFN